MGDTRLEWYDFRDTLERQNFTEAATLLAKEPKLINEENAIGETALHFLAVEDNQEAVAWLHQRGGDLNCTNRFGIPLVFEVAVLGHRKLLQWFIAHGANVTRKTNDGQSIEEYLVEYEVPEMITCLQETITELNVSGA